MSDSDNTSKKRVSTLGDIVLNNFKVVGVVISFFATMYFNNKLHSFQIAELKKQIEIIEGKADRQYQAIDEIKLDKAVFQATINQLAPIQEELKEVRTDIKEILKSLNK